MPYRNQSGPWQILFLFLSCNEKEELDLKKKKGSHLFLVFLPSVEALDRENGGVEEGQNGVVGRRVV